MAKVVEFAKEQYAAVAASSTDFVLGGSVGDVLRRLVITVSDASNATVSIKDGAGSAISIMPATPGGGIGVYTVEIGARSVNGPWKITTGSGATVEAFGRFSIASALFLDNRIDVAAAYSLRRVRNAYAGALVRVRRSSDSVEADFGFGQQTPLDIWASISAFIGAGNGFVAKWYDQSGNARDLVQATAANQPQISLLANGLPGLVFDGSNDALGPVVFALSQPITRHLVFRWLATPGVGENHVISGNTANHVEVFGSNTHYASLFAGSAVQGGTTEMPVLQRGVIAGLYNGASSRLEINAATISSFTGDTGSNAIDGISVGARAGTSLNSNIEVQELIDFSTAHSQGQMQADNAAMRVAWNF